MEGAESLLPHLKAADVTMATQTGCYAIQLLIITSVVAIVCVCVEEHLVILVT